MASDVQEPFNLSFQVNALHSSSISFGRFELESLSWERRSSFSHNRYLEDVEKYAVPGSVTEKKAYFEAHFRKRALLRQASSESHVEKDEPISENGSYVAGICEESRSGFWIHSEDAQPMTENVDVCHFDETPEGSVCEGYFGGIKNDVDSPGDSHADSHMVSVSNIVSTESIHMAGENAEGSESPEVLEAGAFDDEANTIAQSDSHLKPGQEEENVNCYDIKETPSISMTNFHYDVILEPEPNDQVACITKDNVSAPKATISVFKYSQRHPLKSPRPAEKTRSSGIRSQSQGDVPLMRKPDVKKGADQRQGQTPLRARTQRQMPEATGSSLQTSIRLTGKEKPQTLKPKSTLETRREKENSSQRAVTLQPSTPERSEPRRPSSATSRTKQIVSKVSRQINRTTLNSSFWSTASARKLKEDKTVAGIGKIAKKPDDEGKLRSSHAETFPTASKIIKVPTSNRSYKAPDRTLLSANRPTTGSKLCSNLRDKPAMSRSNSARFNISMDRINCDMGRSCNVDVSLSTRKNVLQPSQRKHLVSLTKEETTVKKRRPRIEHVQVRKEIISVNERQRAGLQSSGTVIPRKSTPRRSDVGHYPTSLAK